MKRLYLLSMLIMLFVSTSALASPRTYSQAKAIAERKAALLGIKIDKKAAAKAPSMNGGTTTAVSPYYVFPFGENKGFAIVSGDDDMPRLLAMPTMEPTMPTICLLQWQLFSTIIVLRLKL